MIGFYRALLSCSTSAATVPLKESLLQIQGEKKKPLVPAQLPELADILLSPN